MSTHPEHSIETADDAIALMNGVHTRWCSCSKKFQSLRHPLLSWLRAGLPRLHRLRGRQPSRLKITHRLFTAHCVAAIVNAHRDTGRRHCNFAGHGAQRSGNQSRHHHQAASAARLPRCSEVDFWLETDLRTAILVFELGARTVKIVRILSQNIHVYIWGRGLICQKRNSCSLPCF